MAAQSHHRVFRSLEAVPSRTLDEIHI